jgi:hypothetical protein
LALVAARALAKSPEERWQDAAAMAEVIRTTLHVANAGISQAEAQYWSEKLGRASTQNNTNTEKGFEDEPTRKRAETDRIDDSVWDQFDTVAEFEIDRSSMMPRTGAVALAGVVGFGVILNFNADLAFQHVRMDGFPYVSELPYFYYPNIALLWISGLLLVNRDFKRGRISKQWAFWTTLFLVNLVGSSVVGMPAAIAINAAIGLMLSLCSTILAASKTTRSATMRWTWQVPLCFFVYILLAQARWVPVLF